MSIENAATIKLKNPLLIFYFGLSYVLFHVNCSTSYFLLTFPIISLLVDFGKEKKHVVRTKKMLRNISDGWRFCLTKKFKKL